MSGGVFATAEEARESQARAWREFEARGRQAPESAHTLPSGVIAKEFRWKPVTGRDALDAAGVSGDFPINRAAARRLGERMAREAERVEGSVTLTEQEKRAAHAALCNGLGVEYPVSDWSRLNEAARLQAPDWWGRKIRVADWRAWELKQITAGNVTAYVSDGIARARKWHRAALADMLERVYLQRADDPLQVFSVAELSEKSTANPVVRRAEMLARIKGFDRLAEERGWSWVFFTLTCPSKFHRLRYVEETESHILNPKWEEAGGPSPRDAQQHLRATWARWRAWAARKGLDWLGYRIAEPHLDGCPHWHGILWARPEDLDAMQAELREQGLKVDGGERGAAERRVTFERQRASGGSAIAYVVKYVSKNIDGKKSNGESMGETTDRDGRRVADAVEAAARVEAWASVWGIRQFQECGGPGVTAYRELRRVSGDAGPFDKAAKAADAGDYAEFARQSAALQLELWAENAADLVREEFERRNCATAGDADALRIAAPFLNRWGEPARRFVRGVQAPKLGRVKTRLYQWVQVLRSALVSWLDDKPADRALRRAECALPTARTAIEFDAPDWLSLFRSAFPQLAPAAPPFAFGAEGALGLV